MIANARLLFLVCNHAFCSCFGADKYMIVLQSDQEPSEHCPRVF